MLTGTCTNTFSYSSSPLSGSIVKGERNNRTNTTKGYLVSGVTLNNPVVLSANYYDDYSFTGHNGIPDSTDTSVKYETDFEFEGFGKRYMPSSKGLLTGSLTAQLDDSSASPAYLYSVMYYDHHGRIVQAKSNNHLSGGLEKEYYRYNFAGQPLKRKHVHLVKDKPSQYEVYNYAYDHAGRLLTTVHQLNEGPDVTLVDNEYDELGRLKRNKRNGQPSLQTDYAYNIRSWTKSISSPLFSQTLYYNDSRSGVTNTPCYNGNISGMDWNVSNDKSRGYDFFYDALSRLTGADYLENNSRSDKFATSYSYDKHGNILSLKRSGNQGTTTYGEIDDLTLSYHGNQLMKVEDAALHPTLPMSMDFRNDASQEIEYSYDANGNQTKDLNKGIACIEYNFLNLPIRINFSGTNNPKNEYVYSAAGNKLSVIHKSTTEKRTDYVGNMIYENGSLKRILVDGGYIEDGVYYFYIQDHLGNNRVVVKADETVVQTNHYYPFGMSFAESTQITDQPYRYNGKELDIENGLNLYDYDARQMDGAVGGFTTVDPMAEKYYSISPYVYCANNPVKYIDLNGKDIYLHNVTRQGNYPTRSGLSPKTEDAMRDLMKTTEGKAFFGQFARKGDVVGGCKFTKDGALSDYKLVLWDYSFSEETSLNVMAEPASGSYEVTKDKNGKPSVSLKIVSYSASKQDIGETLIHETQVHGYKVSDDLQGKRTTSEEQDHRALKKQDEKHSGYKKYKSVQNQLEIIDEVYKSIFRYKQKLYDSNYK